jgi:hypothetical protein
MFLDRDMALRAATSAELFLIYEVCSLLFSAEKQRRFSLSL